MWASSHTSRTSSLRRVDMNESPTKIPRFSCNVPSTCTYNLSLDSNKHGDNVTTDYPNENDEREIERVDDNEPYYNEHEADYDVDENVDKGEVERAAAALGWKVDMEIQVLKQKIITQALFALRAK